VVDSVVVGSGSLVVVVDSVVVGSGSLVVVVDSVVVVAHTSIVEVVVVGSGNRSGSIGWQATAAKTTTHVANAHTRLALPCTTTPASPTALARRARIRSPRPLRTAVGR
jgi:hypothetical protein